MSLYVNKTTGTQYDPVFKQILSDLPGGITLRTGQFRTTTEEARKGTMIAEDATSAGLWNIVKTAKLIHAVASDDTIFYVDPKNELKVGDYVSQAACSGASIAIITTGTVSDAIVITYQLTTNLASAVLLYGSSTGSSAALYEATSLLRDNVRVKDVDLSTLYNITAGAVVRGTVNESALPFFIDTDNKTSLTARIIFD